MKTTQQINEWFSKELENYEYSNENENLNELNVKLSEVTNKKWYSEEELKKILNDYRVNKEDIKSLPRYSKHYNDAIDDIYYALFGEEYKQ